MATTWSSNKMAVPVSLLCVCFLLLTAVEAKDCSLSDLAKCKEIITSVASNEVLPSYTKEQLKNLCAAASKYQSCVNELLPNCAEPILSMIRGTLDSNEFVCTDGGRASMERFNHCFKDTLVEHAVLDCFGDYNRDMYQNPSNACSITKQFIHECLPQAISPHCDARASSFVQELSILAAARMFKTQFHCDIRVAEDESNLT